jgi:hypothetical protein
VLIEELLRRRYELPPLAALLRIATQARSEIHETIYRAITDGSTIRSSPESTRCSLSMPVNPAGMN